MTIEEPIIDRGQKEAVKVYRRGVVRLQGTPKYLEHGDLMKWAKQFGDAKRAVAWKKKTNGKPTTLAFVEFASADVAKVFAEKMTGTMMMGKPLRISFCPDVDYEKAKKMFPRGGDYTPTASNKELVNAALAKRWTVTVKSKAEAAAMSKRLVCYGSKKMEAAGVSCPWTAFESLEAALAHL